MKSAEIGTAETRRHSVYQSPHGRLVLVERVGDSGGTGAGLEAVFFTGQKHAPAEDLWGEAADNSPLLREASRQLDEYFAGRLQEFSLPLVSRGTPFQQAIWSELQHIPLGECRSYGELAAAVGSPRAWQATGQAVGRNPWVVVVPCHRVIGSGCEVTGYAGGVERKLALLAGEGVPLGQ